MFGVLAIALASNISFGQSSVRSNNPNNKTEEIRKFASKNGYNEKLAFFVDFSLTSNKYRFFVIDLKSGKVLEKGLVAHGSGSESGKTNGS